MVTTAQRYEMFINGQWQPGASGELQAVVNPSNGETIAEVPKGTEEDVDRAVRAARHAFENEWYDTTPGERSAMLLKLADTIEQHAEELAALESVNVGKPKEIADFDIEFAVDNVRFFAGACRTLPAQAGGEYARGFTSILRREPVGVVGSIAPWNYPLMMAVWKIGPALAAGNTVVLKPSELTPLSALRLAELAAEIFPAGVLNVITGDGEPVGAGLVRHPEVAMVSLTGDVATGKEVARAAASTLKRVHLELGGKAPVIVFDDADIEGVTTAVRMAGFYNSGQDCTAATRVLAADHAYDNFLSSLKPAVESIKIGSPSEADVEMGPMVSEEQRQRVMGFVERAHQAGAEVLVGGEPGSGPGFFYRPSIVAGVSHDAEIARKEVFGPVISVERFASDDEAIAHANSVDYGLAASVWTTNAGRALNAARKLRFGTVWINDHLTLVSEMPHGGFKQSGYGKDMSQYSIEDYTELKHVMAKFA